MRRNNTQGRRQTQGERVFPVEFANFTLKFGDDLDLLDLATEVVVPAFTDPTLTRKYVSTVYRFLQPRLYELRRAEGENPPIFALIGEFVQRKVFRREQILTADGALVESEGELESAPSSYYALLLHNHTLLLLPKTADAPKLQAFETTAQRFLTKKYNIYVRRLAHSLKRQRRLGEPMIVMGQTLPDASKVDDIEQNIREIIKPPTVDIIPIPSRQVLSEWIDSLTAVHSLSFKVRETNSQVNNRQLFKTLREGRRDLQADSANVGFDSKEGLDKEAVKEEVAAVDDGTARITIKGTTATGQHIEATNDTIKLKRAPPYVPRGPVDAAVVSMDAMNQLIEERSLPESIPQPKYYEKVEEIRNLLVPIGQNRAIENAQATD